MKTITAVALGFILAAVIGVALASGSGTGATTVGAADSGSTIELAVGETLNVTLESNPTTGFSWALAANSDESVLQEIDHEYVANEAGETPMVGSGGVEDWTFKALAKGETTISMEYSRPWEGGEKAAQTFELTVVVN
jgi:inhibitor of cysteine peptidase